MGPSDGIKLGVLDTVGAAKGRGETVGKALLLGGLVGSDEGSRLGSSKGCCWLGPVDGVVNIFGDKVGYTDLFGFVDPDGCSNKVDIGFVVLDGKEVAFSEVKFKEVLLRSLTS